MISTLYELNALGTSGAFVLSLLIGFGFGFALELAGFGSSRRLAGVFYFTDMAVVKVMFSALLTAALGLSYLVGFGWMSLDQVFLMPTVYGAQIAGGLLFGVGFVMGGWCPGTAAAGVAAGRIDALVFLVGAVGGSICFSEVFPDIKWLYEMGDQGVQMAYDTVGLARNEFILALTLAAVAAFWISEWVEKARTGRAPLLGSPFLVAFSFALVGLAGGLFILSPVAPATSAPPATVVAIEEKALLQSVEDALDHIEPEELADRMVAGDADLVVVDVRPATEFTAFHLRGALNVPIAELAATLEPYRSRGLIVLYSNGMTHPAQARDSLQRQGFDNVFMLSDGLQGFRDRCLKPVSLRPTPLTAVDTARVHAWRAFFTAMAAPDRVATVPDAGGPDARRPRIVETDWLAARLGTPGLKVIDLRSQPEYNTAHVPGALALNVESLRGNIGGVPSLLLPPAMLAAQFSLLGLQPADTAVILSGDKLYDTTLAGMAFERLGHQDYAVLNGGYAKWQQEGRLTDTVLPAVTPSTYPVSNADGFTVDFRAVLAKLHEPGVVIIDVRPAEYFAGTKSDEARAGHLPGAISHPFTEDVIAGADKLVSFKPSDVLAASYRQVIPTPDTTIIVHCRTGHQASQTYFVLKRLLGYPNVRWYDAGWTEWAARPELPIATGTKE